MLPVAIRPSWRWFVSSHGKGVFAPPVSAGGLDLLSFYGESMLDGLGAHTDVCDFLIMIMGQLRRSGCRGGEGPAAKLGTA
jgi:hypothetical protein